MPEKEAAPTGLQVNDTPASNNMEGVETEESTTEGEGGEKVAAEASEGETKKKGPSNMVSGWGKNAKVLSLYTQALREIAQIRLSLLCR